MFKNIMKKTMGAPPLAGRHLLLGVFAFCACLLSCCASPPTIQPQINALVVSNHLNYAVKILDDQKSNYGPRNQLLYCLDKAYILQLAGRFDESISYFEKAKVLIDTLYTQSVTKIAATWLVNDFSAPYRGENFEHVLVNIFQALNFAALNNINEALVDARDVDLRLSTISRLYDKDQKDSYRDDAFARLLMGILYESTGSQQDLNDAFISYKKSLEAYESNFYKSMGAAAPRILKENLLAAAQSLGFPEFEQYHRQFPAVKFLNTKEKESKGQIYLIQYNGLSPIKHPSSIVLPFPPGIITKFSFLKYTPREYDIKYSVLNAKNATNTTFVLPTETANDLASLAIKDLKSRQTAIYAKAVVRPVLKTAAEAGASIKAKEKGGEAASYAVQGASSLFNLFSEQADTRSWQTLPAEIRIARLVLEPGTYDLSLSNFGVNNDLVDRKDLGRITLKAGEKKFLITRTVR